MLRFIKVNGALSAELGLGEQRRGLLQGCSFSAAVINYLSYAWTMVQFHGLNIFEKIGARINIVERNELSGFTVDEVCQLLNGKCGPDTRAGGYADDQHTISITILEARRCHVRTLVWTWAFRAKLNGSKTVVLSNLPPEDVSLFVGIERIKVKKEALLLGDWITVGDALKDISETGRLDKMMQKFAKLSKCQIAQEWREKVVESGLISVLYLGLLTGISERLMILLRRRILNGIRGKTVINQTSVEVAFSLYLRGHRVDPKQLIVYNPVTIFSSYTVDDELGNIERQAILEAYTNGCEKECGPVALFLLALEKVGWSMPDWKTIALPSGKTYPIPVLEVDEFKHDLRDAIRNAELSSLTTNRRRTTQGRHLAARNDMRGIENGINFEANRKLYSESDPLERGALFHIGCGGVLSRDRAFRHQLSPSRDGARPPQDGVCQYPTCKSDGTLHTTKHLFWCCPQYQELRCAEMISLQPHIDALPNCLTYCGLSACEEHDLVIDKVQASMVRIFQEYLLDGFGSDDENDSSQSSGDDDQRKSKKMRSLKAILHKPGASILEACDGGHSIEDIHISHNFIRCAKCGQTKSRRLFDLEGGIAQDDKCAPFFSTKCRPLIIKEKAAEYTRSKTWRRAMDLHEEWSSACAKIELRDRLAESHGGGNCGTQY